VPFTDVSSIATGSITSWEWNFGDGSPPGLLQHPGHMYPGIGPYTVVLTVTDANGCSDSVVQVVNPVLQPTAVIAYTPDCNHTTVQFSASLAYSCGPVSKFKWDFGDGGADSTTLTPAHTYPATGIYTLTLLLTAANQVQGTVTMQVIVPEKPVADFSVTSACLHEQNLFTDLSTVAYGNIMGWEWKFGDGNAAYVGPSAQHTYAMAGSYEAKLTVVSDFNCRDSVARPAMVWELPVSGFSADVLEGCEPLEVSFTAQSIPGSGTISGYNWNFGNGAPDSVVNPLAVFPEGTFDVSLVTINSFGCRDTFTRPLYITAHPIPVPDFTFSPNPVSIFYPEAHFLCVTPGLQTWHWNFGDGSEAGGMQASHLFPGVGIYQVMLEVISEKGCPGSVIKPVEVVEEFTLYFPNAYTPNGDGINDLFTGIGTGIEVMELFVYDRWGNVVYKTNDYGSGWDGTVSGTHAGEGIFTYLANVTDLNGIRHSRKGTFALIR
jgi:gliding motility-associated-like protein